MTNTEPRKIKETIKAIIEQFDRYPEEKCNKRVKTNLKESIFAAMEPKYPLLCLGLLGTHLDSIQQEETNRIQSSLWRWERWFLGKKRRR
jgi:hypothetical protein